MKLAYEFFIPVLEHCDIATRARFFCISGAFFGVGYGIMPLYAYYIRDWSSLQLAFSLTTLSLLSYYWCVGKENCQVL